MNAEPFLSELARQLERLHFDVVLIGNAAAALQGAPVTTVDFDFMFRKTPANMRKLKALATSLGATVLKPYYPVSDLFRVTRDDGLQIDFMTTIHGVRSFAGLRSRASSVEFGGATLLVASCSISSAARKPRGGPETWPSSTCCRGHMKKRAGRAAKLAALRRESDRALVEMIRRQLALPREKRTNFLRKRLVFRGSAL